MEVRADGAGALRGNRPARRGLTLVELMVVLSILGVTAAVVIPGYARLTQPGPAQVVGEIVSTYAAGRSAAITRGRPATVALEFASGGYWVVIESTIDAPPDTVRRGTLRLGERTRLRGGSGGWAVTRFGPLGNAWGGPVIVARGEEVYSVVVDAWTAEIDVQRR